MPGQRSQQGTASDCPPALLSTLGGTVKPPPQGQGPLWTRRGPSHCPSSTLALKTPEQSEVTGPSGRISARRPGLPSEGGWHPPPADGSPRPEWGTQSPSEPQDG